MFKELAPLLASRSLVLMISKASDDQISVSLIPKSTKDDKDEDKALLTPLQITATAEELDNELANAITDYTSSYKTVAEQVANTKAAMKAAADAAAEAAKAKANSKSEKDRQKHVANTEKRVAEWEKNKNAADPAKAKEEKDEDEATPSLFDEPQEVFEG